jgi:hypothetical protein
LALLLLELQPMLDTPPQLIQQLMPGQGMHTLTVKFTTPLWVWLPQSLMLPQHIIMRQLLLLMLPLLSHTPNPLSTPKRLSLSLQRYELSHLTLIHNTTTDIPLLMDSPETTSLLKNPEMETSSKDNTLSLNPMVPSEP